MRFSEFEIVPVTYGLLDGPPAVFQRFGVNPFSNFQIIEKPAALTSLSGWKRGKFRDGHADFFEAEVADQRRTSLIHLKFRYGRANAFGVEALDYR